MTQKKTPYIENAYEESADYGDMLNNNAIVKIESMMDDSDDDYDEVFNTQFIDTSVLSDFSKSLNDIHTSEKPLERPNSLAIRTDEHFSYPDDNAVSNSGNFKPQQPFILHRVVRYMLFLSFISLHIKVNYETFIEIIAVILVNVVHLRHNSVSPFITQCHCIIL